MNKQMFKPVTEDWHILKNLTRNKNKTKMKKWLWAIIFRKKWYKTEDNVTFPPLVKEEADKLEGLIILQEASITLKIMQNGKSSGTVFLDFEWLDFFKLF